MQLIIIIIIIIIFLLLLLLLLLLLHKMVKTNGKIRCFGVVMTPLSRKI